MVLSSASDLGHEEARSSFDRVKNNPKNRQKQRFRAMPGIRPGRSMSAPQHFVQCHIVSVVHDHGDFRKLRQTGNSAPLEFPETVGAATLYHFPVDWHHWPNTPQSATRSMRSVITGQSSRRIERYWL